MMKLPSFSKQLDRQAPAASVMPVFTPVKPSIPSSRFVFTQLYVYSFSLYTVSNFSSTDASDDSSQELLLPAQLSVDESFLAFCTVESYFLV